MATNSQLLACKAEIGQDLYYVKPTLRVSPYFQVLALLNSFKKKIQPTLIKQELQAIKYIKQYNSNYIKLIKCVNLLRDDYHKHAVLISESHGDSN
jgi:hypothetical protein